MFIELVESIFKLKARHDPAELIRLYERSQTAKDKLYLYFGLFIIVSCVLTAFIMLWLVLK